MFLLVLAHPGCPGQFPQSRKTVVCVCVYTNSERHANNYRLLVTDMQQLHIHYTINQEADMQNSSK